MAGCICFNENKEDENILSCGIKYFIHYDSDFFFQSYEYSLSKNKTIWHSKTKKQFFQLFFNSCPSHILKNLIKSEWICKEFQDYKYLKFLHKEMWANLHDFTRHKTKLTYGFTAR